MTTNQLDPRRVESLGPAERVIQALLSHSDHAVHNRPGIVVRDARTVTGVRWEPATYKEEGEGEAKQRIVYRLTKVGKKTEKTRVGVLGADDQVRENNVVVASYRWPGIFPEVAAWMWRQIAEVWKLDNEFAARWASYSFGEDHKDLKVALAAFMLVQSRRGDPVRENGEVVFFDDDFRDVGEAMCLIRRPDGKDLSPKLLLRTHEFLTLPAIAQINRELGFGISTRRAPLGRWESTVNRWLAHRETNPKMLEGLVKAGLRTTVMELVRKSGYKPTTAAFFKLLRWKQKQSADGRRTIAIGDAVSAAESWVGLTEAQICQKIVSDRPNWKRVVGLLPPEIGVTRAIMAAAVQSGALSNADLIILTPTLEDLGLLGVEPVKSRWEAAIATAENQRAANIATRVRKTETVAKLAEASDNAMKTAVAEVTKGLRIYFFLDISGSMQASIEQGKRYIAQFLQGIPLEQLHAAVFNTVGREVAIKHASAAGVEQAFRGLRADGGTDYGAGVLSLQKHRPTAEEDVLFIFVGDQQASVFTDHVRRSALNPVAFGLLQIGDPMSYHCVTRTAGELGIPCFKIEEAIFTDPYAVTRTLRNLISATPVRKEAGGWASAAPVVRVSLVEKILKTDLLVKPVWASSTKPAAAV